MIATRLPVNFVPVVKTAPASRSSSTLFTRTAPVAFIAASTTRSPVASAPVCEAAASAPASERPAFKIAVGFFDAISRNCSTSVKPSV